MSSARKLHGPTPTALRVRGLLFLGAIVAALSLVFAQFTGALAAGVSVRTTSADTGDALVTGSDVKLRGVVVGRVDAIRRVEGRSGAVLDLRLFPAHADDVPAGVTSRILTANVFGQNFVELLPHGAAATPIRVGTMIPEDTSAQTLELNDVFAKLYRVLTAVQPAKLSLALGALAQALNERGASLNATIGRADAYLDDLGPSLPRLGTDLEAFARFTAELAKQAPKLLDSIDDLLVLTRLLVARQGQFIELLSGGLGLTGTARDLLVRNEKNLVLVTKQSAAIFSAFGKHPRAFSDGFVDLGAFLGGIADPGGPARLDVRIDPDDLPRYGPADCPRYPGLTGPNCPAAAPTAAGANPLELTVVYGGIGPIGSVSDRLMLGQVLAGLAGDARLGDVGMLLAGSVLRGLRVALPAPGGTS